VQSGQGGGLTAAAGDSSHAGGARAPLTTFEDIAARLAAPKEACGSQVSSVMLLSGAWQDVCTSGMTDADCTLTCRRWKHARCHCST
jgi:hypothetical protein